MLVLADVRCYHHLVRIPHEYWADYEFKMPRFGQYTSNLVEQQNWVYLRARELPVFDMLQYIWNDMMEKVYKRHTLAHQTITPFPPNIVDLFRSEQDAGRTLEVRMSSSMAGLVYSRLVGHQQHTVKLDPWRTTGECTCGLFDSNLRPCSHGHAFLDHVGSPAMAYVDYQYTCDSWKATYAVPMPPIRIDDLEYDDQIRPPSRKRGRGRPALKRQENGKRIRKRRQQQPAVSGSEDEFNHDVLDSLLGDPETFAGPQSETEAADILEAEQTVLVAGTPCQSESVEDRGGSAEPIPQGMSFVVC